MSFDTVANEVVISTYDFSDDSFRLRNILDTIARTKKVLLVCGGGVSVESGLRVSTYWKQSQSAVGLTSEWGTI